MQLQLTACVLLAVSFVLAAQPAGAQEPPFDGFPFSVPYDGLVAGTAPADLAKLPAPAGADGFVQVRGDEFVLGDTGRRARFWATNLSIAGCFPPHDVADRMARRMASLGINCVRMHFMDAAGYPGGLWDTPGWGDFEHRGFHPEALDRLDYLVAQLKRNGVYTDLNLHVARAFGPKDGFPAPAPGESVPELGKGVGLFYPRAIEEQRRYARMLMRHVNPYTGKAYAEEPAVAMVEITNENGLLSTWFGSGGDLDQLPQPYVDELGRQFNVWLRARYASKDELRRAWAKGAVQGGEANLLTMAPWMQTAGTARATMDTAKGDDGADLWTVRVQAASDQGWHTQLLWRPVAVEQGKTYLLRMRLRASREQDVFVSCGKDHDPWGSLGLWQSVRIGPDWQEHEFPFVATESDAPDAQGRGGARVSLSGLPVEGLKVQVTGVDMRLARVEGLPDGQELGSVRWVPRSDWQRRTEAFQLDVLQFMLDTEAAFYQGMREYLHGELGCRMPVTGTSVGNVTPDVAARTADYLDAHAYWQHPNFPRKPWDAQDWVIGNSPMVNKPADAITGSLAGRRVFGLPFTVSELNHPAPSDYRAEGFPLAAVYGAFQGWDGLFTYTYAHGDWETDHVASFFDLKADPIKLAEQPACSAIFREGLVGPAGPVAAYKIGPEERLRVLRGGRAWSFAPDAFTAGADRLLWQRVRIGLELGKPEPAQSDGAKRAAPDWTVDEQGRGCVRFADPRCAGLIGFAAGKRLEAGPLAVTPGASSLDGFCVVLVNPVDGQDIGEPGRCLITAVARAENRGMGWNEARTSVGSRWGDGPTLCEGVPLRVEVRAAGTQALYALRPDGTRGAQVAPAEAAAGLSAYALGPAQQTLWYELVLGE